MCVPNDDYFVLVGLNEETKILVMLLLYTGENCSRKFHDWVHLVPSQ